MSSIIKFQISILLLFICTLAVLTGCSNGKSAERLQENPVQEDKSLAFINNYDEGVELAHLMNKPMLLFFVESDCVFSKKMMETVFTDSKIIELAKNFVCVRIDIGRSEYSGLCEKLKVVGSPTIQFMSSLGIPLQRITQYQPKEELARQMEVVLYSVAWKESVQISQFY